MSLTPGYAVRGAVQGQGQQMPPEYVAQQREQNRIKKMVNAYKANPNMYSDTEAQQISMLAVEAGIPFQGIKSGMGSKLWRGAASAADTMALGLIPNSLYAPRNAGEQKAVDIGSVAGMVAPWGAPMKLAKGGLAAAKVGAKSMGKGGPAMQAFLKGSGLDKWFKTGKGVKGGGTNTMKGVNWKKVGKGDESAIWKEFAKVVKDKGFIKATKGKNGQDYIDAAMGYINANSKGGLSKSVRARLAGLMRKKMGMNKPTPKVSNKGVPKGQQLQTNVDPNFTMGPGGPVRSPGRPMRGGGGAPGGWRPQGGQGVGVPQPSVNAGPPLQLPGSPLRLPPGQDYMTRLYGQGGQQRLF